MVKSIIGIGKAGRIITKAERPAEVAVAKQNAQHKGIYRVMKKISTTFKTPILMLREFIWTHGRYNKSGA